VTGKVNVYHKSVSISYLVWLMILAIQRHWSRGLRKHLPDLVKGELWNVHPNLSGLTLYCTEGFSIGGTTPGHEMQSSSRPSLFFIYLFIYFWPRANWELVRVFYGLNLLIPIVNPTEQLFLRACCDGWRTGTMLWTVYPPEPSRNLAHDHQ
jgi:hypothetical protein